VRATVENSRDRLKGFLAGSIPNLDFDNLLVNTQIVGTELHSDCHLMLGLELIVHNTLHKTRFADTSISNNNQLKQVVMLCQRLVMDYFVRHTLKLVDLFLLHDSIC
jgi:hypothetical protein